MKDIKIGFALMVLLVPILIIFIKKVRLDFSIKNIHCLVLVISSEKDIANKKVV